MDDDRIALRPAVESDAPTVRSLVSALAGTTPYTEALAECLDVAIPGGDGARATVAVCAGAHRPEPIGVVVYGDVAGTRGAGRLHLVAVSADARRRGAGERLVHAAVEELAARGARLVVAELPDDPSLAPARALLARCGFAEEGRVPDFYPDGVALTILRRSLAP